MVLGIAVYVITNKIKIIGIFKHQNYWEDLLKVNHNFKKNHSYGYNHDRLTYLRTEADILIETNKGDKLYSGVVSDYFIDMSFKLQTIILSNAKRYKKDVNGNLEIKSIPGHNFILNSERVLNINLTYVYQLKEQSSRFKIIENIIGSLFFIIWVAFFVSVIFLDSQIFNLSILGKISLLFFVSVPLLQLSAILTNLLTLRFSKISSVEFFIILAFGLPILSVYDLISFSITLLLEFILIIVFSLVTPKKTKKHN